LFDCARDYRDSEAAPLLAAAFMQSTLLRPQLDFLPSKACAKQCARAKCGSVHFCERRLEMFLNRSARKTSRL
jgi:hypothetical protein